VSDNQYKLLDCGDKKKVEQFESQWISSLKIEKNTYQEEDEAWMAAEVWGEP